MNASSGFDDSDKGLSWPQPRQAAGFDDLGEGLYQLCTLALSQNINTRKEYTMLRNFTLYVEKDYPALSRKAAEIFAGAVNTSPKGVYGFATGSTPVGMYEALIEMHKAGKVNLSEITAFNLDEYYPISPSDPQSYRYYMRQNLFDAVGIPPASAHIPDGEAKDPLAECAAYEAKIAAAGGIDLQILGIGNNGHIGFNEPAKGLMATTGYTPLAEATIKANARFFEFEKDIPRHALTMGMHSIMMARQIIMLVSGEGKAQILKETLHGPITTNVPASLLQLHRDVIVVADAQAASLLDLFGN